VIIFLKFCKKPKDQFNFKKKIRLVLKKLYYQFYISPLKIMTFFCTEQFFAYSVHSTLKTEFLELLTRLTKEGKAIPLNIDQRVQLVQLLLNDTVKSFDFDVLDCTKTFMGETKETFVSWKSVFESLWSVLAAKCPNLHNVREMIPSFYPSNEDEFNYLNNCVFNFRDLRCLETNCFLTSGLFLEVFKSRVAFLINK